MARARQLKPGFFKNEDLARCTPWARLMFEGLWTLSDREGRLEDRPTYIKGELFPHDNLDAEVLLAELANLKDHFNRPAFILRYRVGECKYIQIINFSKHQNPHVKEPASIMPAPDKHSASTRRARCKVGTHTERAPEEHRASRASSLFPLSSSLTPDSPLLTPDSKDSPAAGARCAPEIVYPEDFLTFWKAYPRKIDKGEAFKAWQKIQRPRPDIQAITASIAALKASRQWQEKNGRFIPHPSTWLNRRGWESQVSDSDMPHAESGLALPPLTGV